MKKTTCLLLFAAALSLRAADTNAPTAPDKSLLGQIPDASHAPVRYRANGVS